MDTPFQKLHNQENADASAAGSSALQTTGADAVSPPSGNTGGKLWEHTDPNTGERFLICLKRYGSDELNLIPIPADGSHPYSAITDYLNCTFRFNPESEPLEGLFHTLFAVLGDKFAPAVDRQRGLHGYKRSFQLGESSAQFAIGGNSGTALLTLPGEACELIKDWHQVVSYLRDIRHANITRWDGAVDDYLGVHSLDDAVTLYRTGLFNAGGNDLS